MLYTELTKKAMKISFEAHKNQVDKNGIPYIYHPIHLAEQMDDENTICVALLHDVVEDTDITFEELQKSGFNDNIIEALKLMTHDERVSYMDYVREIKNNGVVWYMMAIKWYVNDDALTREESDFYITKEEYEHTVVKGLDNTIYKKRYQFDVDGLTYAVDIFEGNLEGLAYLEIEFESEELANSFETPDWIIKDVTNDRRFKNQELAQYGMPKIN